MKKLLFPIVLVASLVQIGTLAGARDVITYDGSGFLSPVDTIFAAIERIEGDRLILHPLHTVMSPNAETILFVGDEVHASLDPLLPEKTRRGGCVTAILSRQGRGAGMLLPGSASDSLFPGCLARLQDFRGGPGLPAHDVHLNQVVRIMLSGDFVFDPQIAASTDRKGCDGFLPMSVDFTKKMGQPLKFIPESNRCEEDGSPRPMTRIQCRLGNLEGSQWAFTDNHGRTIEVSVCEADQND